MNKPAELVTASAKVLDLLPNDPLELRALCALLDDAEADTKLWLQVRPSAEERVYVHGIQQQLSELYGIVTHKFENRVSAGDEVKCFQSAKKLLSQLRKAREVRGWIVGQSLGRLERRLETAVGHKRNATDKGNEARPGNQGKSKLPDRRAMVNDYIDEVRRVKRVRITRKDIWSEAGYNSRTEFERWERRDPKHPNQAADRSFSRVLREKPHLK